MLETTLYGDPTSKKSCRFTVTLQPYITKAYFGLENPPVNLKKIAIGDGSIGSLDEFVNVPTVSLFCNQSSLFQMDDMV